MKKQNLYAWERKQYKIAEKDSRKFAKMMIKNDLNKAIRENVTFYTSVGIVVISIGFIGKISNLGMIIGTIGLIGTSIATGKHILKKVKENNVQIKKCRDKEKILYEDCMKFHQMS